MRHRNILLLVANGAHARILRRDAESGELHTVVRLEDGPAARDGHAPYTPDQRSTRSEAYAKVILAQVADVLRQHPAEGVIVSAPAHLMHALHEPLGHLCKVIASTQKDLVKLADHDLKAQLASELNHADLGFA